MRLNGFLHRSTAGHTTAPALVSAVCLLGALAACGGGEKNATDTTASATTPAASATTAAPASGAATATGTAKPITGKTVDVKMIGDAKGYRFEPADFTVKVGDGAKFTNVTGGPHDVTFWPDSIPAGAAAQLNANMEKTMAPLTGELLTAPNQTYTVSFADLPPGVYHYYCTPHLALGMKGTITVQ